MLQKIKDHQDFAKDCNSGSIVNTNRDAFEQHLRKKEQAKRIDNLETKLERIESLLESLLESTRR